MEGQLIQYYLDTMEEMDPDVLVSDLRIESDELLEAFKERAIRYIEDTYG